MNEPRIELIAALVKGMLANPSITPNEIGFDQQVEHDRALVDRAVRIAAYIEEQRQR